MQGESGRQSRCRRAQWYSVTQKAVRNTKVGLIPRCSKGFFSQGQLKSNTGGRTLVWTHENIARTGINGQHCSCGCCSRTQVKAAWLTCKQLMNCQKKKKKKSHTKRKYIPPNENSKHTVKAACTTCKQLMNCQKKKRAKKPHKQKSVPPSPPNKTTPKQPPHTHKPTTTPPKPCCRSLCKGIYSDGPPTGKGLAGMGGGGSGWGFGEGNISWSN